MGNVIRHQWQAHEYEWFLLVVEIYLHLVMQFVLRHQVALQWRDISAIVPQINGNSSFRLTSKYLIPLSGPFVRRIHRWIPPTKGQQHGERFFVIMSLWTMTYLGLCSVNMRFHTQLWGQVCLYIYEYIYRQSSNISRTLVENTIVDHPDVVGASPVVAAPTTSSYST